MAKKRWSTMPCGASAADLLDLEQRPVAVVLPGQMDRFGGARAPRGLLDQGAAVPGEQRLLDDGRAVGCQPLLRHAAAERVVPVAPAGPVGGGDAREAVLRVPGVTPGVRLAGQPGLLTQHHAALGVVLVAHGPGADESAALVLPAAGGLRPGHAGGPGGMALVARLVVRVVLLPSGPLGGGDAPGAVEGEGAPCGPGTGDGEQSPVLVPTVAPLPAALGCSGAVLGIGDGRGEDLCLQPADRVPGVASRKTSSRVRVISRPTSSSVSTPNE